MQKNAFNTSRRRRLIIGLGIGIATLPVWLIPD